MNAEAAGCKRAREYLARNSTEALASLTFVQYCGIGRVDASKQYKTRSARDAYALGWFGIGKQFLTLFKADEGDPYVIERKMAHIATRLETLETEIAELFTYRQDDKELHTYLDGAYEDVDQALYGMRMVYQRISRLNES